LLRVNESKPIRPWPALLVLTGLNVFNYLDRQVLPSLVKPISAEFKIGYDLAGAVGTAFMLGYFLTSPIFGYLGDRMQRKWLIAIGVVVWSLGTVLTGMAGGLASLFAFRVLVGFGEASYGTLSPSWIADLYAPAKRNAALTIFYIAIPVGTACGAVLAGQVSPEWGWRAAFYFAGVPGLLLALCVLWLREPARGASEPAGRPTIPAVQPTGAGAYLRLLRFPTYLLVVAGYVPQAFAMGGFQFWGITFLQDVHGMDETGANNFFGLSVVLTGLTATLAGGYLATWWRRRHPAGYAWVLALSALAAVPAAFAAIMLADHTAAKAALAAAMFCLFFSTGPVNTLILEAVPATMRASAMAASIFAIHAFGDVWSPLIGGMLQKHFNSMQKAMLILPAALGVCAALWLWLAVKTQRAGRTAE
jgi:predicted MFS family arabinose efflux permease